MDFFPFSVAANGNPFRQPATGQYVRYLVASAGSLNPAIEVRGDKGGRLLLFPGQSGQVNQVNEMWTVTNYNNEVDIVGVLVIGDANEFQDDDRISGEVSVTDGGKATTLAGLAFDVAASIAGVAAEYAHLQLWNPLSSGRNVVIEKYQLWASADTVVYMCRTDAVLSTAVQASVPKLIGFTPLSQAQMYKESNAVFNTGDGVMRTTPLKASIPLVYEFKRPYVLRPGYGLIWANGTVNQNLNVSVESYEEAEES